MNALLRAEFLRLTSRRLTWFMVLAAVALAAFVALSSVESVRLDRVADPGTQAAFEETHREWERMRQECSGDECGAWPEPKISDFIGTPLNYTEYIRTVLLSTGLLALIGATALSASMVGAEFVAGTMGTQLTFTPRRLRLMGAKLVAATAGALALVAAYAATSVIVGTIAFMTLRGAGDVHAGVELPQLLGRLLVLALLIGALSSALTIGVGSSVLTAGILTVVMVGSLMISSAITRPSPLVHVLPSNVASALLEGRHEAYFYTANGSQSLAVVEYPWAVGFSTVCVILVICAAAFAFHRRDILR